MEAKGEFRSGGRGHDSMIIDCTLGDVIQSNGMVFAAGEARKGRRVADWMITLDERNDGGRMSLLRTLSHIYTIPHFQPYLNTYLILVNNHSPRRAEE